MLHLGRNDPLPRDLATLVLAEPSTEATCIDLTPIGRDREERLPQIRVQKSDCCRRVGRLGDFTGGDPSIADNAGPLLKHPSELRKLWILAAHLSHRFH